jgi:hypothetical protein
MPEDQTTLPVRQAVIRTALAEADAGSHYLWGANQEDVRMHPDVLEPEAKRIVLTASWRGFLCAGRPKRTAARRKDGDPNNPGHRTSPEYLWPRLPPWPTGEQRWGESCLGKRHFDCKGFIWWCIRQHVRNVPLASLWHFQNILEPAGEVVGDPRQACVADILLKGFDGHIAFVASAAEVVESMDSAHGVVRRRFRPGEWDAAGRFTRAFWQGDMSALSRQAKTEMNEKKKRISADKTGEEKSLYVYERALRGF